MKGFDGQARKQLMNLVSVSYLFLFYGLHFITPHPSSSMTPVSLRLGHGLALTVHRTVIHYQSAALLPQGEGCGVRHQKAPLCKNGRPHRDRPYAVDFFYFLQPFHYGNVKQCSICLPGQTRYVLRTRNFYFVKSICCPWQREYNPAIFFDFKLKEPT